MDISLTSMRRIVKMKLGMKAYKTCKRHIISDASEKRRIQRARRMLKEMTAAGQRTFIWSDEKMLTVESVGNTQNDRVYSNSISSLSDDQRCHFRTQKPKN